MWYHKYDENLYHNPFFQEILKNHNDLVCKVSQNGWIICIPKKGTLEKEDVSEDLVWDHILVPNTTTGEVTSTFSEKPITIKNGEVIEEQSSRILFEETFYIEGLKYVVFCLDKPLFLRRINCDEHEFTTLETLHDCIDFLWNENLEPILVRIQKLCNGFIARHHNFQIQDLQTQKELIGSLYSQCLQVVYKNRTFSSDCCDNIKLSVEAYMQSSLEQFLTYAINTATCFQDAGLNKLIRNVINSPNFKDCDLDMLHGARWELAKINNYTTTLDKLNCLKLTFNSLYKSERQLTTDDILQNLIHLIITSDITNWISNLEFLKNFQFNSKESDGDNFLVTSLEAALTFIESDQFASSMSKKNLPQGCIFETIAHGDVIQLHSLLSCNRDTTQRCHPLCNCEKCSIGFTPVSTTNDQGHNLLTFATISGRLDMVEFLIGMGLETIADKSGRLPLHYACLSGRQDILLLLMNCKAGTNTKDSNGNTPLHLACENGHDSCVKALFYTTKNLNFNTVNKIGRTPLMLALRYNYLEITRILLENGTLLRNVLKKNQHEFIHNYHLDQILGRFHDNFSPCLSNPCDHGKKPKKSHEAKKVDLLLKAIENNDIPLTHFYLGFSTNRSSNSYEFRLRCHPLCNCEKCGKEELNPESSSVEKVSVNVCNIDGFTPLHFAAKYGRTELLRLLLDSQAFPNLKTYKTHQTALHLACMHQHVQIVKELVKCGECNVDALDYKGNTPLYYAYLNNDSKIIDALITNGANPDNTYYPYKES